MWRVEFHSRAAYYTFGKREYEEKDIGQGRQGVVSGCDVSEVLSMKELILKFRLKRLFFKGKVRVLWKSIKKLWK